MSHEATAFKMTGKSERAETVRFGRESLRKKARKKREEEMVRSLRENMRLFERCESVDMLLLVLWDDEDAREI